MASMFQSKLAIFLGNFAGPIQIAIDL